MLNKRNRAPASRPRNARRTTKEGLPWSCVEIKTGAFKVAVEAAHLGEHDKLRKISVEGYMSAGDGNKAERHADQQKERQQRYAENDLRHNQRHVQQTLKEPPPPKDMSAQSERRCCAENGGKAGADDRDDQAVPYCQPHGVIRNRRLVPPQ